MDFHAIWDFAAHNQILVGGVGTVMAGSVMYLIKSAPVKLYRSIFRLGTIEITLNNQYPLYEEILKVLSDHRLPVFSRLYAIDNDKQITAGYGYSYAFYHNRLIRFNRNKDPSKNFLVEDLDITIFSRKRKLFDQLIYDAKTLNSDNDQLKVNILDHGRGWGNSSFRAKRNIDTVFIPDRIKKNIMDKIRWFGESKDWYLKRGINYKLVILLHGIPGTGKTSLIRALASHFDYRLGVLQTISDLPETMRRAPDKTFIVMEDIDTLSSLKRQYVEDDDGLYRAQVIEEKDNNKKSQTIHMLLNTLDGLNTPDGSIIFMTTNHLEEFDPAIIRPGRVDLCIEIGPLEYDDMANMFKSFYGFPPSLDREHYTPMVGAKLQEIFMRETPEMAEVALKWGAIETHGPIKGKYSKAGISVNL